jgi:hypothetical protein
VLLVSKDRSPKSSIDGTSEAQGAGDAVMLFDLIDIRLFVNIAKANSLTKGAEFSYMSLPAASVRIKSMKSGLEQSCCTERVTA